MQAKATLMACTVKEKKDDYQRKGGGTVLSLTLDVLLPVPTEAMSFNDWFQRLNDNRKVGLAVAQNERLNAAAEAEAVTTVMDAVDGKKGKKAKAPKLHETNPQELRYKLYSWRPDEETKNALSAEHMKYIEGHARANRRAVAVAQEAAIFLLLIRKEVRVTIAPLQASFGAMLGLKPDKKMALLAEPGTNGVEDAYEAYGVAEDDDDEAALEAEEALA
ncbi:MAG: hypothetical protein HW375_6 [Anaerolineales bacterium]|nr:hypothetical protein [Anaerolineales bacterium]